MFLNTASPPGRAFAIPVNINLQGARRRQTREIFHPVAVKEQVWRRGGDVHGGQRAKAQVSVSSVGEDRAVLLGFTMMAFSVLMYFVVGITLVKPSLNSGWDEETNCSLDQTKVLDEWDDCRGLSTVPCLIVLVNLTHSGQTARLHYNEESLLLNPECFYIPKCQKDKNELLEEALRIQNFLVKTNGSFLPCLTNPTKYPEDAILERKYTLRLALWALLWPSLMLGGAALLVGLVKLNQHLSHVCSGLQRPAAEGKLAGTTTRTVQGKLYQLLRRRSRHSPMQEN